MSFQSLIDKKVEGAKYMIDEITKICTTMEKRPPGSKGEEKACKYMAKVLREECGCERADVEPFKEHPGAFYGWVYFTMSFVLLAIALFFVAPLLSVLLIAAGMVVVFFEFGIYKRFVDPCFPEMTGHNVTAVKKCKGEVKRRIFFNGHPDAVWEWPVNYALGGVGFEGHAVICVVGSLYYFVLALMAIAQEGRWFGVISGGSALLKPALWGFLFVPFLVGLYWIRNVHRVVDGANDNLSGCYIGITLLKKMKEEGIELENTEVGVIISGSEESGLRGAKAWCEAHKGEFEDVPTFIFSYDTIHDPKFLMVNYRDLNGTVKADKDVSDLFMEAARAVGVPCKKGMVPLLGGSTDSAAFAQAGLRVTGITGLNHKLESYYHTRRDSYDNLNAEGLANCYAATLKALEMFDQGAKQSAQPIPAAAAAGGK